MPNSETDTYRSNGSELSYEQELEDDEVEPELEALFGLAQMDAEAVVAYEIAAEDVGSRWIREKLLEFAADHRRHVEEIAAHLHEQGVEPAAASPDPESSTFAALTNAMSAIGAEAARKALQASELFTNAAYAAALEVIGESSARRLVARNLADEQRHARWLADHQDLDWDEPSAGQRG